MPTTITGGMPHCLVRDDEYMGFKIPAGAAILNNVRLPLTIFLELS